MITLPEVLTAQITAHQADASCAWMVNDIDDPMDQQGMCFATLDALKTYINQVDPTDLVIQQWQPLGYVMIDLATYQPSPDSLRWQRDRALAQAIIADLR